MTDRWQYQLRIEMPDEVALVARRDPDQERVAAVVEQKLIALLHDLAAIKTDVRLMKWMHGIAIGGVLALLVKAFFG